MKKTITTFLFLAVALCCMAQKIQFNKFERLETSAEAKTQPRIDRVTKENCALMHIYATDINSYVFEGKIEGEPIYKNGEAIIYMRPGALSLTAKHPKYGKTSIEFDDVMETEKVYSLHINVVNNKTRTLVMPMVGIGKTFNYGIMVGLVKKYGGYIKGKYDFKSVDDELECNKMGYTMTGDEMWFNGQSAQTRFSVTAGVLYRVKEPLYLYGGLGYGNYTYAWQTTEGQWARNTDASCNGVNAEVGAIGRWKNVAFGLGVETCQFKYWELNVGIGVIF